MRIQIVKHYLMYSNLTEDDLEDVARCLSLAKMRRRHNMNQGQWAAIRLSMINEAECNNPGREIEPCGTKTSLDDCFIYEEFTETLYLYYNVGKDTKVIERRIV